LSQWQAVVEAVAAGEVVEAAAVAMPEDRRHRRAASV
jgi:hypothetical protein